MTLIERLLAQANKESNELADLLNEAAQALAQPQQAPKFLYDEEEGLLHDPFGDAPTGYIPLYTSPPVNTTMAESLRKQLLTALDTAINEVGHKEVALGLVSEKFTSTPAHKQEQEPVYVQLRYKDDEGYWSPWGTPLDPSLRNKKWAPEFEMRLLYDEPPARR